MSMKPDISIIASLLSPSINKTIDYANKRNITTEIVENLADAKGYFIFIPDTFMFYYEYYLHVCYINLQFHKLGKNYDSFTFDKIVNYDEDSKEFFMCNDQIQFFRKNSKKSKTFKEYKIIGGCTTLKAPSIEALLPEDRELIMYDNYFKNLK
jgi:hypothetical protein